MPSPRIIVVGSFVQDLTFNCTEFPRPGETIIGNFITGPGGKGSNQAVAAARAGGEVAFLGAVGRDAFADGARSFHAAEGIQCLLAEKSGCPTGAAGILVNSHGQNEIVVSLGANGALAAADIDCHVETLRSAGVLVTQLEANLAATAYALRMARAAGATVVLNPAPMRPDFDPALLAEVEILIPNETEFATLVQMLVDAAFREADLEAISEPNLHALCRRLGVPNVIVTLGGRGCFISQPGGFQLVPAMRGVHVVDTTGAGDAFVGAFAAALAEGGSRQIGQAARFANAAAAISVTRPGTAPAMATRVEIEALLQANAEADSRG